MFIISFDCGSICKYQKPLFVRNTKFHIDNFRRYCLKTIRSICNNNFRDKNSLPSPMPISISSVSGKLLPNFVSSIQIMSIRQTLMSFIKASILFCKEFISKCTIIGSEQYLGQSIQKSKK